jgi:beta-glucosidase-like glycosyl hydrolase
MKAVADKYGKSEVVVKAFQAGCDILLFPESVGDAIALIEKKVQKGEISLSEVNERCLKVLAEKHKFVIAPKALKKYKKEEIEFALNLIEINKIKVSPLFELKVKTKIAPSELLYEQRLMAPLISIDLIENAFKHADLQNPDAFISIVFEFNDNVFYMTVSNKISPKAPLKKEKSGIGAETLEQRLRIIYKDNFKLERFTEGDVFIAHLKINLLEHKAKMLAIR